MMQSIAGRQNIPTFAVLLAAHNGEKWISEQIRSILDQKGVWVRIFVSIDLSTDKTYDICKALVEEFNGCIDILPVGSYFGGAGPNFYRLINEVDFSEFDYVAFSDQDDIWFKDKLWRAQAIMDSNNLQAYSSNVVACWPSGRKLEINKAQSQKEWDFLFEAAGPGSTYVLKNENACFLKGFIKLRWDEINQFVLHDWLIYAFFRAQGWNWFIDSEPSLYYRQHEANQVGANQGMKQAYNRLAKVRQGWYRNEIKKLVLLLEVEKLPPANWVCYNNYFCRLRMLCCVAKFRRRVRDQVMLFLFILFGFF
ncbi:dTDP-rhamnosyl transferase RfbG [Halomonas shantousis]